MKTGDILSPVRHATRLWSLIDSSLAYHSATTAITYQNPIPGLTRQVRLVTILPSIVPHFYSP